MINYYGTNAPTVGSDAFISSVLTALSTTVNVPAAYTGDTFGELSVNKGGVTLPLPNVPYIDANGDPQTCDDYTTVSAELTIWPAGWYVVSENVTINNTVTMTGDGAPTEGVLSYHHIYYKC